MKNFLLASLSLHLPFSVIALDPPEVSSVSLDPIVIEIAESTGDSVQISGVSNDFLQNFCTQIGIHSEDADQWQRIESYSLEDLLPGDLLLYGFSEKDIQMIIIHLGKDQFLKAAPTAGLIDLHFFSINESEWKNEYPYQTLLRSKNNFPIKCECPSIEEPVAAIQVPEIVAPQPDLNAIPPFVQKQGLFEYYYANNQKSPLIISLIDPNSSAAEIESWIAAHQIELKGIIESDGALLLRNFPIETASQFASLVESVLGEPLVNDLRGEASRTKYENGVYNSIIAPADYNIPLHHTLSCTNNPARFVCFFCETPPQLGTGQTILAKTSSVNREIQQYPEIWNFFNGQKIKYIFRHPPKGHFFTKVNHTHQSWNEIFQTDDKEEVERICQKKGIDFRWKGDWIELYNIVPAIRDPDAFFDIPYWYNQIHLFHQNHIIRGGWKNHILANLLYIVPSTRQCDVELEDGTPIPSEHVYKIYRILDKHAIKFDWQQGDVLLVDNFRMMHGKTAYTGARRIFVSLVRSGS